jgi:hypothetical protein
MEKYGVVRDDVTPKPKDNPVKEVAMDPKNADITRKAASTDTLDCLTEIVGSRPSNK